MDIFFAAALAALVIAGIVVALLWALKRPKGRATFAPAPAYRGRHVKGAHRA